MKIHPTFRDLLIFLIISLTGYILALGLNLYDHVVHHQMATGIGFSGGHHLIFILTGLSLSSASFAWWRWNKSRDEIARLEQVQATLVESEARFRQIMENVQDVVYLFDYSGALLYVNPAYEMLNGRSTASVYEQPMSWIEAIHPEDTPRVLAAMANGIDGDFDQEYRVVRPDGSLSWVHSRTIPIRDESGQIYRTCGIARDFTRQKAAEEALVAREQLIQSVLATTPDVVFIFDTAGQRPSYINRPLTHLLGYDEYEADPVFPELLQRFFHPDDVARFQAHAAKAKASRPGEVMVIEYRLRHKDGRWLWFQNRDLVFKRGPDGQVLEFLGAIRDITDQKKAEFALAQERSYLRQVIDAVPGHIIVKDREGRFLLANQAVATTYGTDVANLVGKTDADFNPNRAEVDSFLASDRETLANGQVQHISLEPVTYPDGQVHWHTTYKAPLFDKHGQATQVLVVSTDITAQKQAQDQIRFQAQLLDTVGQAVIATDLTGRIIYWNEAATTIYGWPAEEALGQNAFELMALKAEQNPSSDQIDLLMRQGFWQGENSARRQDGSSIRIFATVTAFANLQGVTAGIISVSTDITQLKQAEAEIRQLNAELEQRVLERTIALSQTNAQLRQEIALRTEVERVLQARVEMETILAAISTRFIKLTASETETEISHALQAVAVYIGADRARMIVLTEDQQKLQVTHKWCAAGISSQFDYIQELEIALLPRFEEKLKRGQIVSVRRVAALPDQAAAEREFLQKQQTQSIVAVPLLCQGTIKGYLAFDTVTTERMWREEDLNLLYLFSEILVNALQRQQIEEALRTSKAHYYSLFEDSPISLWEEDFSAVKVYLNELRAEGVTDFGAYFQQHPETVEKCLDLVVVTDVNKASLKLMEAEVKTQLLGKLKHCFGPKSYDTFITELVHISQGKTWHYSENAIIHTMTGAKIEVAVQWSVAPGYQETWDRVYVSLIDISQRKQAEQVLRRHNRDLTLFNQIIAASVAGVEPELMLETSCRELATAFDMVWALALLLDSESKTASIVAEYMPQGQITPLPHPLPLAELTLFQSLATDLAPLVITAAATDPRLQALYPLIEPHSPNSLLCLPLAIEGQVVSCLILATGEPRTFTAEELSLGGNVAEQIAGGLARARMAETNQRLVAAIEQVTDSVLITDPGGQIRYVNTAFERVTGYRQAEVLGQTPQILESTNTAFGSYSELRATITAGQIWRGRLVNRKKDGSSYTCDTTITPVYNQAGVLVNFVGVDRDVTQTLELEQQYRHAQKMESIGRMAGGVAHDFNNVLTAIMGYTGLTLSMLSEDDPIRANLKGIEASAERAANLTRQLLAFARKQVIELQAVDLNELLMADSKILRRLITEDIELVILPAEDLGWVRADPGQLEQVLFNLAVNARDAMPQGGKLILETAPVTISPDGARHYAGVKPGEYIRLTVTDTGTGMSDEVKTHLFEPFFTTKALGKGTGLGLATCFGIIKQSDGHIWVESELGKGTTFKIYLPRLYQAEKRVTRIKGNGALPRRGVETILLVEDEPLARDTVAQSLRSLGYTVLEAQNGEEALRVIDQLGAKTLHLLIADLIMPHLGGKALVEKVKPRYPDLKVLLMSGYTDEVISDRYLAEVRVDFLQKPFAPPAMAAKVRAVLDHHKL